ncbi:MAG: pilus assembly protein [Alphaproteobacteria bacterium]|nr:pilus assembly protein [Alphaproteobacteria bacterium]
MRTAIRVRAVRGLAEWWRSRRATAAVEFALILPVLLLVTIGSLELGLIMFDYHRVSEATRRGLRTALIQEAIIDLADLDATPITCTGPGNVSCSAGSIESSASFDAIVASMQEIVPRLAAENVIVTYTNSSLDISGNGDTVTPLITVEVTGLEYNFVALTYVSGLSTTLTMPSFDTTRLAHTVLIES